LDVVILLDISAQARIQRASRLLVSDLGHELRTPIATVLTHLEILGLDDLAPDVQNQSLRLARSEAQRMARLVNDMLELGRLEMADALSLRPLDIQALVEDVVAQVVPRASELAIAVNLAVVEPLPLVLGHSDRLRQVVLNLLDNALRYAGSDAEVTLTLRSGAGGVECSVCDTGPGIPAEHLPYIGQRFYRAASEESDGSGLGLALVREILRHHSSDLTVASPAAEGRGACFRFVLPIARGRDATPLAV
jgi:signal transduction histidine kinase